MIDVSVLMLFFNRPDHFQQVFAEVKKARPARLFLYQDGPRGERDMAGIKACREICSDANIDWDCEVHRHYCEQNQGCDPSGYLSQTWAFSQTDKCIVLEDDVVPAQSFFPFCKELLDRYENDERVGMIAGFNAEEETKDAGSDYFFTSAFSIWGWASWKRVVDTWDRNYSFMDDPEAMAKLQALIKARGLRSDLMKMLSDHRAAGKPFFETVFWSSLLLHDQLAIMPRLNQTNNVGFSGESTHYGSQLDTMPRRLQRIFTMRRFELQFPLKHPQYVIDHVAFKDRLYRINAWNNPAVKVQYSLEELWHNLKKGNFIQIGKALNNRVKKWTGRYKNK